MFGTYQFSVLFHRDSVEDVAFPLSGIHQGIDLEFGRLDHLVGLGLVTLVVEFVSCFGAEERFASQGADAPKKGEGNNQESFQGAKLRKNAYF